MPVGGALVANNAKRKKAISKKKSATRLLDERQRSVLVDSLSKNSESSFLVNLLEGKSVTGLSLEIPVDPEAEAHKEEDAEPSPFPSSRPTNLSERHYFFLQWYYSVNGVPFNPTWLNSYFGAIPYDSDEEKRRMRGDNTRMSRLSNDLLARRSTAGEDLATSPQAKPTTYIAGAIIETLFGVPDESWTPDLESATIQKKLTWRLNEMMLFVQLTVAGVWLNTLLVASIFVAGVLVGVQSYPQFANNPALSTIDLLVQIIFTVDCSLKIIQEGPRPWNFWTGPEYAWNNFDFWLVVICYIPDSVLGLNPIFLRLMRLARLLKLVSKVKALKVIVMGLLMGFSAVKYIVVLLVLVFFLFAVLGVGAFRRNDPFHFGGLGVAFLTLFRMTTLENCTIVWYLNMFGCNTQFPGVPGYYSGFDQGVPPFPPLGGLGKKNQYWATPYGSFPMTECWHPHRQAAIIAVYYVLFIIMAAFIVLSLFIGAVCGGMNDAMTYYADKGDVERQAAEKREARAEMLAALKDVFNSLDEDGSGQLDASELAEALRAWGQTDATEADAKEMIQRMDQDGSGTLDMKEVVFILSGGEVDLWAMPKKEARAAELADAAERNFEHARRPVLTTLLQRVWGYEGDIELERIEWRRKRPIRATYERIAEVAEELEENNIFRGIMICAIFLAGASVAAETELSVPGSPVNSPALNVLDILVLSLFTIEIGVKVIAKGMEPWTYFDDAWNRFDFGVVAASWIFRIPELPNLSSLVKMLRLLRLLRLLKLVKALPELRIMVEALITGFDSIAFVVVLLFIVFYIYANIGVIIFRDNDPSHFGNLGYAFISLFRSATFDNWSDIIYTNMLGCDNWGYDYGRYTSEGNARMKRDKANCNHPQAFGWLAPIYFVSFAIIASQVLLTLFVGIVTTSMSEAKERARRHGEADQRLEPRLRSLGLNESGPAFIEQCRRIFDLIDFKERKRVRRHDIKILCGCLPHVRVQKSIDAADIDSGGRFMKKADVDKLFQLLAIMDKLYSEPTIEFSEFLIILDFMRRSIEEPSILASLRTAFNDMQNSMPVATSKRSLSIEASQNLDEAATSKGGFMDALQRKDSEMRSGSAVQPDRRQTGTPLAAQTVARRAAAERQSAALSGDQEAEVQKMHGHAVATLRKELSLLTAAGDTLLGLTQAQWNEVVELEAACAAAWDRAQQARFELYLKSKEGQQAAPPPSSRNRAPRSNANLHHDLLDAL